MTDTKTCKTCGATKSLNEYYTMWARNKLYYNGSCKVCKLQFQKKYGGGNKVGRPLKRNVVITTTTVNANVAAN